MADYSRKELDIIACLIGKELVANSFLENATPSEKKIRADMLDRLLRKTAYLKHNHPLRELEERQGSFSLIPKR